MNSVSLVPLDTRPLFLLFRTTDATGPTPSSTSSVVRLVSTVVFFFLVFFLFLNMANWFFFCLLRLCCSGWLLQCGETRTMERTNEGWWYVETQFSLKWYLHSFDPCSLRVARGEDTSCVWPSNPCLRSRERDDCRYNFTEGSDIDDRAFPLFQC